MDVNKPTPPSFPISRPDFAKYAHVNKSYATRWRFMNLSRYFIPSVHAASEGIETELKSELKSESKSEVRPVCDIPVLVTDEEVQAILSKETGRDRLAAMFTRTDAPTALQASWSPELKFVQYIAESTTAVGFVFGFTRGTRLASEERMTKHLTVRYPHKVTRLRRYYDAIFIKGVKLGLIFGLTSGIFSGLFMLMAQSIAVYRNRSSFVEYACAGAVTATLSRIHIGPRAMLSGGVLGASLGTIGGAIVYGCLLFTKETQEQKHYWRVYERLRFKKQVEMMSRS